MDEPARGNSAGRGDPAIGLADPGANAAMAMERRLAPTALDGSGPAVMNYSKIFAANDQGFATLGESNAVGIIDSIDHEVSASRRVLLMNHIMGMRSFVQRCREFMWLDLGRGGVAAKDLAVANGYQYAEPFRCGPILSTGSVVSMSQVSARNLASCVRMVTIKLKLIGMDRAVNPDLLEAVTHTNDQAREMAERYEQAGPFTCEEHPDGLPVIEVSAIYQASVKVRKVKFCCQALADAVDMRMGQPTSPLGQKLRR